MFPIKYFVFFFNLFMQLKEHSIFVQQSCNASAISAQRLRQFIIYNVEGFFIFCIYTSICFFFFESQIERVHSPIPRLGGRCKGQPRVNKTKNFCFFSRLLCCYFLYAQTYYILVYCTVYTQLLLISVGFSAFAMFVFVVIYLFLWHMPKRIHLRSNLYCVHTDNADSSSSTCDVLRCYFSTISV